MTIIDSLRAWHKRLTGQTPMYPTVYPVSLDAFFIDQRCPDCGGDRFRQWQDGGHDVAIECRACGSKFGVQQAPFNLIERIGAQGGRA